MENSGISVSQAMREVGYSKTYAKNPHELTGIKSFQALLDAIFPQEQILQMHFEMLNKMVLSEIDLPISMSDRKLYSLFETITDTRTLKIVKMMEDKLKRVYFLERDTKAVLWAIYT